MTEKELGQETQRQRRRVKHWGFGCKRTAEKQIEKRRETGESLRTSFL